MAIKYKGKMFSVESVKAKVNGRRVSFDRINENGVAVMLALRGGKIVMEKVKRVALGKRLLEVPAGHIERGEKPEWAAKREFEEETGYRASKARMLFSAHMVPGLVNNTHHYFLLTGISKGRLHREFEEEMEITLVSPKRALSLIRNGKMVDGKSMLLVLYALQSGLIKE